MPQPPSARAAHATQTHLSHFTDPDMAYHESGHAVILHLNGSTIKRLSIDRADPRRGTQGGPQRLAPPKATTEGPRTTLQNTISVLVAGDAAGTIFGTTEFLITAGSRVDHEQALRAAAEAGVTPEDARAMIDDAWERALERLRRPENWRLVDALAQELIEHRALEADRISAILKG
jgi:hypothetical protein